MCVVIVDEAGCMTSMLQVKVGAGQSHPVWDSFINHQCLNLFILSFIYVELARGSFRLVRGGCDFG